MQETISHVLAQKIVFPHGKLLIPEAVYIDAQNGKVTGLQFCRGFLPIDSLHLKEGQWESAVTLQPKKIGVSWLDFRVENRRGRKRGKVCEIWISVPEFQITKFECAKKFLGWFSQKRIFAIEDVFEVLPQKKLIIVEEENKVFQPTALGVGTFEAFSRDTG